MTHLMDHAAAAKFATWFDQEIGTEYEINAIDGQFYVMGYDLLPQEVGLCKAYEQGHGYHDYSWPQAEDLAIGRITTKGWLPKIQQEIGRRDLGREARYV